MKCEFTQQPDTLLWHCCRCGYVTKKPYAKPPKKECKPGIGDKVEQGLSFLGITKQRFSRLFKSKKCGCKKRKNWLNRVGARLGF